MSTQVKVWLLMGALLAALPSGCAEGAEGGDLESGEEPVSPHDSGEEEEEDASEPEDEPDDAGEEPDVEEPADAGLDATSDAASEPGLDANVTPDAAPEAGLDASSDVDTEADTGTVDTGAPDAGTPDTGRPPPRPLPTGPKYGEWTWVDVPEALCRDGSPAGYYHRLGNDNLMIFLNGSGACMDSFFCELIPRNVNESMTQETLLGTSLNALVRRPEQVRQTPPNEGILKRTSANPVASWSMIFVPYCTGDVHAGANPTGNVPGVGPQKFVGYTNIGLFLQSFGPSFPDTKRVLLAGTGAGGFGALLNMERIQDYFDPQGAQLTVIADSGIPFQDQYLEVCLQKRWRELWNLDAVLPKNCTGCRNPDGGGLAMGLGTYLFKEKYKGRMMGGMISSSQDEIVKVFFSAGLNNCTIDTGAEAFAQTLGFGAYPADRFPAGLRDVVNNVAGTENVAYYVLPSSRHMHLWRSRFYQDSDGLGQTMASWVADVLAGKPTHRGAL